MKKKRNSGPPVVATFTFGFDGASESDDGVDVDGSDFAIDLGTIAKNVFKSEMRDKYYAVLSEDEDASPEELISDLIEGTRSDLESLIEQAQDDNDSRVNMAKLLMEAAQELGEELMASDVIEPLNKLLRSDPNNPLIYHRLGNALITIERYEAAVLAFREAVRCDPGEIRWLAELGSAERKAGDLEAARAAFTLCVQTKPESSIGYAGLAFVELDRGEIESAVDSFQNAIACDPKSVLLRFELALACVDLGNIATATAQYRELVELDADAAEKLLEYMQSEED